VTAPLLEVKELSSGYGDLPVLHGVSFDVNQAEVVSVVGANGAGKTTLLGTLAGAVPSTGGHVLFNGTDLTTVAPHKIAELGLVLVPEGRKLFPFMTVEENLRLGGYHKAARAVWRDTLGEMYDMFPRLKERRNQTAGSLSGGEQQMCAIARGLMALPKLIMLDEPSLGLAPIIVEQLFELLAQLAGRGLAVLLVEQYVAEALVLSARANVLEHGHVTVHGDADQMLHNPELRRAYLGAI
jgi:branched-chain amino acid transport system ATP-binding protein